MESAMATVNSGRVELQVPDDWPEGLQVMIVPITQVIGINEAGFPTSPEGVEALLSHMDKAFVDGEEVDFQFDWKGWDEFQLDAVRQSWAEPFE